MIRFTADISDQEIFDRAFNRLDSLDDFRPIWPEVIRTFYEIETEQFDSEGQAGGARWAPLSPVYAAFKAAEYPGQPILRRDDDLYESLTSADAFGAILRPEPEELVIGTSVPHGVIHQRGTRNMPARPPINMSDSQKRRIQKSIQVGLVRFVREAGFEVEEKAA